jgi:O-antigen ligase
MMLVCGLALTSVRLLGPTDTLRFASSSLVTYVIVCAGIAAIFGSDAWVFDESRFRFTWFAVHPLQAATWTAEAALLMLARSLFPEYRRLARQQRFWRFSCWMGLLSLFLVLVLTNSRGPLIAFLSAAGLVIWKTARAGIARGVVTAVTVLVLSVLLFDTSIGGSVPGPTQEQQGFLAERFFRGGDMDTLRSLNGRVEVWEAAVPLIIDKPLLGYGYHGSRTLMFTKVSWASYAHSAYVQSLLDFGIVGALIIWGALAWIFLRLVLRPFGSVTGMPWCDAAMTGIVAFLLVSSVSSESLISSPGYEPLLMFVVASIIGHYRSSGLKAFQRSSSTAMPTLRLARQGGYRAYRDL